MTDHPLTDEICYQITIHSTDAQGNLLDAYGDLRAAADWQLEQVIEWIEENGYEYVCYHYELGCQSDFSAMMSDLKKAMRPQQQEDN